MDRDRIHPPPGAVACAQASPCSGSRMLRVLGAAPIRILLIGDSGLARAALRVLLEKQPQLRVVGESATCAEALAGASSPPDILLLDVDLERGCEGLAELLAEAEGARPVVLASRYEPEAHERAVRLGALGVVSKGEPPEVLLKAIEKVHAGEAWLHRAVIASVLSGLRRPESKRDTAEADEMAQLSKREREVIPLVAEGLRNKQIADRLFISKVTVRHHLTRIFQKLEVGDRLELMIYAFRHGLAKPPR